MKKESATNKENMEKKTSVKVFEKKDLYRDVKAEKRTKMKSSEYLKKLRNLEIELVKLQEWVKANKL